LHPQLFRRENNNLHPQLFRRDNITICTHSFLAGTI
jgi:hypothetical protein